MKCRKTIYCEYLFLKSLPQEHLDELYRFLNESVIFFDVKMDQFLIESKEDTIFKYIMKRQVSGGCELRFDIKEDEFESSLKNSRINPFNPVVLIYQSSKQRKMENKCGHLTRNYGILAADQSDFYDKCNLGNDYGFAIKKSTIGSWRKMLERRPVYGNSLVIVDNYLLNDSKCFDLNLEPILNALLPDNLNMVFNLTFITQDPNSTLKSKIQTVENLIRRIRPKLQFTVNFFIDVNKVFHDRVIISNYIWIQSGAGFDLLNFKPMAKHSTTVSIIYPFIQTYVPWAIEAFCNLLEDAKGIVKSAVNNGEVRQFFGMNKDNRLFEMT